MKRVLFWGLQLLRHAQQKYISRSTKDSLFLSQISVIRWINYPLVMTNIASENGHRNSELSHKTWWFSSSLCKRLPGRVYQNHDAKVPNVARASRPRMSRSWCPQRKPCITVRSWKCWFWLGKMVERCVSFSRKEAGKIWPNNFQVDKAQHLDVWCLLLEMAISARKQGKPKSYDMALGRQWWGFGKHPMFLCQVCCRVFSWPNDETMWDYMLFAS